MGRFSRLVNMKDKGIVAVGAHLFPEHLDDPQKTLSLQGVKVAEMSAGLQARVSLVDPLA